MPPGGLRAGNDGVPRRSVTAAGGRSDSGRADWGSAPPPGHDASQRARRVHRRRPGIGLRREPHLHRERSRPRRAHLQLPKSTTPQSCPWGVIACPTPCALEPDVSEATSRAALSSRAGTGATSGSRAISTTARDPLALRPAVAGGLPLTELCCRGIAARRVPQSYPASHPPCGDVVSIVARSKMHDLMHPALCRTLS